MQACAASCTHGLHNGRLPFRGPFVFTARGHATLQAEEGSRAASGGAAESPRAAFAGGRVHFRHPGNRGHASGPKTGVARHPHAAGRLRIRARSWQGHRAQPLQRALLRARPSRAPHRARPARGLSRFVRADRGRWHHPRDSRDRTLLGLAPDEQRDPRSLALVDRSSSAPNRSRVLALPVGDARYLGARGRAARALQALAGVLCRVERGARRRARAGHRGGRAAHQARAGALRRLDVGSSAHHGRRANETRLGERAQGQRSDRSRARRSTRARARRIAGRSPRASRSGRRAPRARRIPTGGGRYCAAARVQSAAGSAITA